MFDFVFYNQPFRRWILKIYEYLPGKLRPYVLGKLYPDDCLITIADG